MNLYCEMLIKKHCESSYIEKVTLCCASYVIALIGGVMAWEGLAVRGQTFLAQGHTRVFIS